jgi:gas vesicle protein
MRHILNFMAGATLGALIGASVVLLLTPTSGRDIRNQMRERALSIQSEVKQAAEQRRSELEKQLADLRAPRKSVG